MRFRPVAAAEPRQGAIPSGVAPFSCPHAAGGGRGSVATGGGGGGRGRPRLRRPEERPADAAGGRSLAGSAALDLIQPDLTQPNLIRPDLTQGDLTRGDLTGPDLIRCDLIGFDLTRRNRCALV